jgi:hypothetical protein
VINVLFVDTRNIPCRFLGWICVSGGVLRSGDFGRLFAIGRLNLEEAEVVEEDRPYREFVWDGQSLLLGPFVAKKSFC